MTPENFCYWLQGFFELHTPKRPANIALNEEQSKMIEEHLQLVFRPNIQSHEEIDLAKAIEDGKKRVALRNRDFRAC